MNKKILLSILSCALPATPLFAMQQGDSFYPAPSVNHHVVVAMQEMQPITIPLQQSSIDYVNRTSKWSALAGACAGLGVGYYVLQNHGHEILQQQTELFRKVAIPTVSTILASGAGYCIGNLCATYSTQEKNHEAQANRAISLHNSMINASNEVNITEEQRRTMNNLPFESMHDNDRLRVYEGLNIGRSENPVNQRVSYARDKASKLRAEKEAADSLGNRPDIFATSSFLENHRDKAATMNANRARINHINGILSYEKLNNWATYVAHNAPEYKTDTLRKKVVQMESTLQEQENNIRYDLARLASLIGCGFSHIHLSANIWNYLTSSVSTNYPNTHEGRYKREADIAWTKDRISRNTQTYQTNNINYLNQVIEHNNTVTNVPQNMQIFITQQGGTIGTLQGRTANQNLLAYNNYLNHSNGSTILNWINGCFDN